MMSTMERQISVEREQILFEKKITLDGLSDVHLNRRFSDIVVKVLGKELSLHKAVLWGIPYFKPFLEGEWKDSGNIGNTLDISVDDPLVTAQTFEDVVASAYAHPLRLTGSNVKAILATASFLQMDELCIKCIDFCIEDLCMDNVIDMAVFSSLYCYTGATRLSDACTDFLLIHAVDTQTELHVLPSDRLRELLQSEFLWVQSEYDKFRIVMDVYESKLSALNQHKSMEAESAGLRVAESPAKVEGQGNISGSGPVVESAGPSVVRGESRETVEKAFQDCLCDNINYSSFSLEELHLAFDRIDGMKMPAVMTALATGMLKAQTLQCFPLMSETPVSLAAQNLDLRRDVGWFRIGVEVPFHELDVANGVEWTSPVFRHGGRGWEVAVSRGTKAIGVFVCCRELAAEIACRDSSGRCSACVRFICKRRRCERRACSFEVNMKSWGAREFISIDKLDQYFTCTGTLRLTVAVKLIFSSGEGQSL